MEVATTEAYPRLDVYGSLRGARARLRHCRATPTATDLHRPFVDELTRPNPDDPTGKSTMRRVPDVLDVWFDSGSMSFAQVHYPFENTDWFEHHFPGDFIVEYIGQTRGWFYTMHVLAAAIFDRPAFSTCLSHGIVLGYDGNKMSKSLRNYPDVREVFDRDGADAMRWFLMSSPILRGGNLVVTEQGIRDSVRQVLIPLWNSWYFFSALRQRRRDHDATLAHRQQRPDGPLHPGQAARVRRRDDRPARRLRGRQRVRLDAVRSSTCSPTGTSAARASASGSDDAGRVRHPLHGARDGLPGHRAAAAADHRGDLARPDRRALGAPHRLAVGRRPARRRRRWSTSMDAVRDVCSAGSALRKAASLRNRLPLSRLTVVADADLAGFESLVADELNLKAVDAAGAGRARGGVVRRLAEAHRQRPRRRPAAGQGRAARDQGLQDGRLVGRRGRHRHRRRARAGRGGVHPRDRGRHGRRRAPRSGMLPRGGFVVLDTAVTPELEAEGVARDLVRAVQQARKDAGLQVSDRIALSVAGPADVLAAARTHEALIAEETLATSVSYADAAEVAVAVEVAAA